MSPPQAAALASAGATALGQGHQTLFQSGWFVVGLLTQVLVVNTHKLPWEPLAGSFKLLPLPPAFYGSLVAILLGYCTLTTVMKRVYIRRYKWL